MNNANPEPVQKYLRSTLASLQKGRYDNVLRNGRKTKSGIPIIDNYILRDAKGISDYKHALQNRAGRSASEQAGILEPNSALSNIYRHDVADYIRRTITDKYYSKVRNAPINQYILKSSDNISPGSDSILSQITDLAMIEVLSYHASMAPYMAIDKDISAPNLTLSFRDIRDNNNNSYGLLTQPSEKISAARRDNINLQDGHKITKERALQKTASSTGLLDLKLDSSVYLTDDKSYTLLVTIQKDNTDIVRFYYSLEHDTFLMDEILSSDSTLVNQATKIGQALKLASPAIGTFKLEGSSRPAVGENWKAVFEGYVNKSNSTTDNSFLNIQHNFIKRNIRTEMHGIIDNFNELESLLVGDAISSYDADSFVNAGLSTAMSRIEDAFAIGLNNQILSVLSKQDTATQASVEREMKNFNSDAHPEQANRVVVETINTLSSKMQKSYARGINTILTNYEGVALLQSVAQNNNNKFVMDTSSQTDGFIGVYDGNIAVLRHRHFDTLFKDKGVYTDPVNQIPFVGLHRSPNNDVGALTYAQYLPMTVLGENIRNFDNPQQVRTAVASQYAIDCTFPELVSQAVITKT